MSILKVVGPRGDHQCETPKDPEKQYGAGSVWECDECGKQAELQNDQRDGWHWVWILPGDYLPSKIHPRP